MPPRASSLSDPASAGVSGAVRRGRANAAAGAVSGGVQSLTRGLTQKLLHGPLAELQAGDDESRDRASSAIEHFFLRKER